MKKALFALPLVAAAALALAPIATADDPFIPCPSGLSGIATMVTSCPFADNVRRGYFSQGGPEVVAYSPVTGQVYLMDCIAGFTARFIDGEVRVAVKCFGGSNAAVVVW